MAVQRINESLKAIRCDITVRRNKSKALATTLNKMFSNNLSGRPHIRKDKTDS